MVQSSAGPYIAFIRISGASGASPTPVLLGKYTKSGFTDGAVGTGQTNSKTHMEMYSDTTATQKHMYRNTCTANQQNGEQLQQVRIRVRMHMHEQQQRLNEEKTSSSTSNSSVSR
jgi:hypothetical protein